MIKFNSNPVIVGYIKQLLHSFNLPIVPVYTNQETKDIRSNSVYIKDDFFQIYTDGKWKKLEGIDCINKTNPKNSLERRTSIPYVFNQAYRGFTKNLEIKNDLYDSYTHQYLGNYLRFLRDYKKVDLMSLYNCFNNEIPTNFRLVQEKQFEFDSSDSNYIIYAVPVKFGKTYTISIDCFTGLEVYCGLYDGVPASNSYYEELQSKWENTVDIPYYKFFNETSFRDPSLFKVGHLSDRSDETRYEPNLKLFLKVPFTCTSSIVILEGNYKGFNDSALISHPEQDSEDASQLFKHIQNTALNTYMVGEEPRTDFSDFNPLSSLQLLRFNSGSFYPFADRLIEYLVENAISPLTDIDSDIYKVQQLLLLRKDLEAKPVNDQPIRNKNIALDNHYDTNNYIESIKNRLDEIQTELDDPTTTPERAVELEEEKQAIIQEYSKLKPELGISEYSFKGAWEAAYQVVLYDIAVQEGLTDLYNDLLGYVDKDVEEVLGARYAHYDMEGKPTKVSKTLDDMEVE